jgi:hypothetical protein
MGMPVEESHEKTKEKNRKWVRVLKLTRPYTLFLRRAHHNKDTVFYPDATYMR